ncbi:erythrocyte membrane protein 1, PfEMP1, putative [Plasmodium sp.]|nr:erythrocyte membrane protein 1, PfEMP1, putative [Plasmodium sp.]
MAAQSAEDSNKSAKEVLDKIGGIIQQKVHKEALDRSNNALKGIVSNATYRDIKTGVTNVCKRLHEYETNVGTVKSDPCANRSKERFSDVLGGQCTDTKIKGNLGNYGGACAPYRRLHICDRNLELIKPDENTSTHDILVDVLLTAKHEGKSLVDKYKSYKETHKDTNICTVLARSFADIGDIIRGKDLFLGTTQEKKALEENLKTVFAKLYDNFKKDKENGAAIATRYENDGPDFYQLREDWWALNRNDVWKAITCDTERNDTYFKNSSDRLYLFSDGHCGRDEAKVLTNLDYVPQFLRWFDEWGEEFCRKKNIKLKMAKEACRKESEHLYCSLNGYDCTKTIRNENICSRDSKCTNCSVKCIPYDIWLRNQRKEFEKQTKKYKNEINGNSVTHNNKNNSINKINFKGFYEELKKNKYESVDKFLKLLNEGNYCKEKIKGEEVINFNSDVKNVFSRSQYCQVCPHCGVYCNNGTCGVKENTDGNCGKKVKYTPPNGVITTEITVLYSGDEEGDITEKLKDFCNKPNNEVKKNYQNWKCYYKNSADNNCEMISSSYKDAKDPNVMSSDECFHSWVQNLLIDTIKWENELKDCINNTSAHCNKDCKNNCECYEKWIKQKEDEWKKVMNLLENKNGASHSYYNKLKGLFDSFFFPVMHVLNEEEKGKWNEFTEEFKKKIASSKGNEGTKDSEDTIKVLLDHLKETATICKDNNTNEACDSNMDHEINPCAKNTTTTTGSDNKHATVKQIAQYFKRLAHAQLEERGSRGALKGDASKGQYELSGSPEDFKNLCSIGEKPSNRYPGQSKGPCGGKDDKNNMLVMQYPWIPDDLTRKIRKDFYMSPRRKHVCTSNVEHLNTDASGLTGPNAIHSLLGDILFAAKEQANFIKKKYKEQSTSKDFKDEGTICRAIKYSFADIGDIIKGTDLWDGHKWEKNTQGVLEKIFGRIKKNLDETTIKKYSNDTDNNKYINLRKDWWEANRAKVWEAMKCEISDLKDKSVDISKSHCGYSDHTPLDDYIPQKLRWITEWAEWYCKVQKEAYEELEKGCQSCMGDNEGKTCWENTRECRKCTAASDTYKEKLELWKEQWKTISDTYETLNKQAHITAINGGTGTSHGDIEKEDQPVVNFLFELYKANGGKIGNPSTRGTIVTGNTIPLPNTPYNTTGGYIHEELPHVECQKQTLFCKTSDKDTDKYYAFRDTPHDHDEALKCGDREAPKAPKEKKEDHVYSGKKKPCDIVKEHFKLKDTNNGGIDACNPKKGQYPKWECDKNKLENGNDGACIPPRRQKLCISNLTFKGETKDENKLRDAFVKCAAKETHFAWERYKNYNSDKDKKLNEGEIPEEFKRQMYYTFGDYRDILFGTDICKNTSNMREVNENINTLFNSNNDQKKEMDSYKRGVWWKNHGPDIWEAMLCGLTHNLKEQEKKAIHENYSYIKMTKYNTSSLEHIASRHPFLRWFTEWSDEFCTERQKKEDNVAKDCKNANDHDGCDKHNTKVNGSCASACEAYQNYIKSKMSEYDTQKKKFDDEKGTSKPGYKEHSKKEAPEYLNENCLEGTCKCMQKVTYNSDYWEKPHTTYEDEKLQKKCDCPPPCTIVDSILGDKSSTGYREGCKNKYGNGMYNGWDCSKSSKGDKKGGAVCIPPRRKRLYVKNLKDLKGGETHVDLRQAFIECAAVETFFAWHEFKKEKEKEKKEKENLVYISSHDDGPQKELNDGIIPDEFKRQMFYTFADYRDILFGKDIGNDVEKVKTNINKVFQKDKDENGKKRQEFWGKYGPHIWEGMLCALSYNTEKKEKNNDVYDKLIKNPGTNTPKGNYKYETVLFEGGLDDNATDRPKKTTAPPTTTTKLTEFVKRPQFIRWLEEWAEEFCRKRTHKLERIRDDCGADNSNKNCGDDGFDCNKMVPDRDKIFEDFTCQSCSKSCKSYKKWIHTKKTEFEKQKEKYEKKPEDYRSTSDSIYDQNFVKRLEENYASIDLFLKTLKGPCTDINTEECKIDFSNTNETFKHAQNCAPCSVIGVKCKNVNCSGATENECKGTNITEEDIKSIDKRIEVDMLVSDNGENKNPEDLKVCNNTDVFEGFRKEQWKCGKFCGLDICEPKNAHRKKNGEKQIILIRALFKRWIENFLEDYNKINDKISHCLKQGEGSTCINGCENKCNCVGNWIDEKKLEWVSIKKRFFDQYTVPDSYVYEVKSFLEQGVFHNEVQKAINPFTNLSDFEESSECNDTANSEKEKPKDKDVVLCLLDKLKREIESGKRKHIETSGKSCSQSAPNDTTSTSDNIAPGFPPPFCNVPPNPCSEPLATNVVGVEVVAADTQKEAHDKMVKRSVVDEGKDSKTKGEKKSSLEGDIKKAQFKNGVNPSGLNNVCSITKEYTNDKRGSNNGGPCFGKDNDKEGVRMKIGTEWKTKGKLEIKDPHLFLPPRREHICTSNLEKLDVDYVTKKDNVNDTFLVDVVHATKLDAEKIKEKYIKQNSRNGLNDENDKGTVCRAIKYSFADIGDIIRGKDLWEHDDFKKLEKDLVGIFGKIKVELKDKLNGNYDNDKDDKKHTKLRADWWDANRDKIWQAMQCQTLGPRVINTCDKEPTPLDDYIPQRLRWMTEWAEWYCKEQSRLYGELVNGCQKCNIKVNAKGAICGKGCEQCKGKCKDYTNFIRKWKYQWDEMSIKYKKLYKQAESSSATITPSASKDEKDVVHFLKKLYTQNKDSNNIYATAEGYIHQEAKYLNCDTQNLFCPNKNDDGAGGENYAFLTYPHKYKHYCECKRPLPPPPPLIPSPPSLLKWRKKKTACTIVEEILRGNNGTTKIGECYAKGIYTKWMCDESKIKNGHVGTCMPPRRQKLCVNNLKRFTEHTSIGMRQAFIECAAIETFLLWKKYKEDKQNEKTTDAEGTSSKPDEELKNGTIPEDFKRQMFYTYADYRDICLGKDIGKDIGNVNLNINVVFSRIGKFYSAKTRQDWWEVHGPDIWKGMLCALQQAGGNEILTKRYEYENVTFTSKNGITLQMFAERPQFLRWFTEWAENFCTTRNKLIQNMQTECTSVTCDKSKSYSAKKQKCNAACEKYKAYIEQKKKEYDLQKGRFDVIKEKLNDAEYKDIREYFKEICTEICKCISENFDTSEKWEKPLDYIDSENSYLKDKCECSKPPEKYEEECSGLSVTHSGFADFSAFGGGVSTGKCKGLEGGPQTKIDPPPYDPTNDILKSTIPVAIALAFGSIAFLFIKKKPKSPVDLLRVLDIHKGDYGTPTPKSSNSYIPYVSDTYKGKTYIYMEGDTSGDEDKYIGDITSSDITSSESEYEELDINDIYPYTSPKYKTLIEVVLEPSKGNGNIPHSAGTPLSKGDDTPRAMTPLTDEEWNELKHDFISQYIQSESLDVPQYDVSTELPMNITEVNVLDDGINEKPFITSIHDRDLYSGEEISYNINMNTNSMNDTKYVSNNVYSGIDLINDTLSGNKHIDIYDEVLKRKENELFGTNYKKNISNNSVAKNTNNDPIMNQLDLLHKWLDRHRDMCNTWNNKEDILNKLNEQWNKDNNSGDIPNDNKTLNTDVSIEIDMDETKGKKEFSNMDTMLDDMEDDIYYDVNDDENPSVDNIPMDHNKVHVPKKVHVEMKIFNNRSNGSLEQEFPISDVWNI